MTIERDTSLRDVAFAVCTALHRAGTTAVLTGGSAAAVHAPRAISSNDLDFVLTLQARGTGEAAQALAALGYEEDGQHYVHSINPLFLEFPSGPLAIGDEIITTWDTLREGGDLLHVLSPTDSCRDRLAHFFVWGDRSSLEAAIAIHAAQGARIDLPLIRRWSEAEGAKREYEEYERRISG